MTRGAFLRELGPLIRIYSLSRNTLEEEIMHASSISTPLCAGVKQSQTVEVIRLADVHIVVSHKTSSLKGKRSALKTSSGTGNGTTVVKSKVRRRILDADEDYPRGLPPREISRTLSDLSSPCNYGLPTPTGQKHVLDSSIMSCVLKSSLSTEAMHHSDRICKAEELKMTSCAQENGSPVVLPELLNSSERFLKLNETSGCAGKMISEHRSLSFSLDLKNCTVSSDTWNDSCETTDLDLKNNNVNNRNIYPLVDNVKRTLDEDIAHIDR